MSVEVESIQSILGETPKAEPVQAPPEAKGEKEAAPPAAESKPAEESAEAKAARDEKGRFAKAEEKPAEKQEKPRADVAAIIAERRKRQEAEQRYAELLAKQQTPVAKPSVFENEDAAISARVNEGNQPIREAIYKLSVKTARAIYKDFSEAEAAFLEAMDRDPRLIEGLRASDDPGEYIYSMGIHVRELADVGGDLMKYRDKVTAASQAKLDEQSKQIAALTAQIETLTKSQAELAAVPRSLNGVPSTPVKAGDEDADDIRNIVRFK